MTASKSEIWHGTNLKRQLGYGNKGKNKELAGG